MLYGKCETAAYFAAVLVVETPEKKKVVIAGNFNDEAKKVTVKLRDRYLNIELQPHSFNTFEEK